MSIKIYNAFKFDKDIEEIHRWFMNEIRPVALKEAQRMAAAKSIRRTVFDFDDLYYRGQVEDDDAPDTFHRIFMNVSFEVESDARKNSEGTVELVLFPFEGNVYGIPFGMLSSYKDVSWIKEFGYWDNTDPDETATEEEWAERRRVWKAVLVGEGKSGIPGECGLTLSSNLSFYLQLAKDDWDTHFPTDAERRKRIAQKMVAEEKGVLKMPPKSIPSEYSRILMDNAGEIDERAKSVVILPKEKLIS